MAAVNRLVGLCFRGSLKFVENETFKLCNLFIMIIITVVSLHQALCWWSRWGKKVLVW